MPAHTSHTHLTRPQALARPSGHPSPPPPPVLGAHFLAVPAVRLPPAAPGPWTPLREAPALCSGWRGWGQLLTHLPGAVHSHSPPPCAPETPNFPNPQLGQQGDLSPQGTWVKEQPTLCGPGWGLAGAAAGREAPEAGSSSGRPLEILTFLTRNELQPPPPHPPHPKHWTDARVARALGPLWAQMGKLRPGGGQGLVSGATGQESRVDSPSPWWGQEASERRRPPEPEHPHPATLQLPRRRDRTLACQASSFINMISLPAVPPVCLVRAGPTRGGAHG